MEFNWRPGIGDPTFIGWLTVLFYFLAAAGSYAVVRKLASDRGLSARRREALVWQALLVLFVLLGLNKQLDLQSALTEIGRHLAHAQGWYDARATVQLVFVAGVALVSAGVLAVGALLLRGVPAPTWIALIGSGFVLAFVVIRAASFHRIDAFLGAQFASFRWNAILEIGGFLIVLLGAGMRHRQAIPERLPNGTGQSESV